MTRSTLLSCSTLLALFACGTGGSADDPATTCNEENEACDIGGCDGEGGQMLPGSDCLLCHTNGGANEASPYTYGGTAFMDIDGLDPLSGAIIRITDADGNVTEVDTNAVGNFYGTGALVFPILAEIEVDGQVRSMVTPVQTGACNSCHVCAGAAGGKLYTP